MSSYNTLNNSRLFENRFSINLNSTQFLQKQRKKERKKNSKIITYIREGIITRMQKCKNI